MSGTKRRINSTGRKRINRDKIEIRMLPSEPSEPLKAKISVDLSAEELTADAGVVFEAYHRSSGMRFDCGTIGNLNMPEVFVLDEVDRGGTPLFRLKVLDLAENEGLILASAERIQPRSEEDDDGKRSLFPVAYRDLQSDTWKVEIEQGDRPRLIINKRLPGFSHKLGKNPLLQGLILPAALRFVLIELATSAETGEDEEEGNWKDEWLSYCSERLGAPDDPRELTDENEKANWIDDTVRRFGENCDFIGRIAKMTEDD